MYVSISQQSISSFIHGFTSKYVCSTWGTVSCSPATLTTCGSFWNFFARSMIESGMVAEKRRVCRSSGMAQRIVFMSSTNPISSILSASSSTTMVSASNLSVPRFIWSMMRPGVPTTMRAPLFKLSSCF